MNRSSQVSNPWKKNVHQKKKPSIPVSVKSESTSNERFKEAHSKLQNAVKKHIKDYESSSDEEEVESSKTIICSILNKYTASGGTNDQVARTEKFLKDAFLPGAATCLICISKVKRIDQIWNCSSCFGIFHLICVQRWSKDTIVQQKQTTENRMLNVEVQLKWCCPKCRNQYVPEQLPTKYFCFCGKTEDPKVDAFLVPHSCGEICKKDLLPNCGHKCLLLCHPGPCPPCPVTVSAGCYCKSQEPVTKRCSNKEWSCGNRCGRALSCGKHTCSDPCHPGDCQPCSKKSIQKCVCQSKQQLRDCASPVWQCDKVCNKPLECGFHRCEEVCHAGVCNVCLLTLPRTCPCGKTKYQLACTKETPTCNDTCGKLLECGLHTCNQRCHKDNCGPCFETVTKACRCGQHLKEIQCFKPYFCDVKCKRIRDCNKHPCNRKCCDGNCPPCEKPCGHTLQCGNHKCASVCHRGPCYPCPLTESVSCRCGSTKITVPCGRKNKTKPPRCLKICSIPPDCDHEEREKHRCHFGDCPRCKQICHKDRSSCDHPCSAPCHSAVLVKVEAQKPSMPWEQSKPMLERKTLPCPHCAVPVSVTCLGNHETASLPCHLAVPSGCGRPCGRLLNCGNHFCSLPCHLVESAPDSVKAGTNCETCESGCTKPRPEGCTHLCPKACHPGDCPPCKQMLRIKCHCGLNQPYVQCKDWLNLKKREELQGCGDQCPRNFSCGHRCKANCHSGACPSAELCKKKVKVFCKCKTLRKEFSCEIIRKKIAVLECEEVCKKKQEEEKIKKDMLYNQKRQEEEIKNKKELEKYQKIFEGKRKTRERRVYEDVEDISFIKKNWFILLSLFLLCLSLGFYVVLGNA